jgi:tetratricopeptide (TPR) repeat protein
VIADQYELVRLAGSGGMGQVWEARDRLQGARVALKLLTGTSQRGRARFLREAVVLAELRHPGIVRYVAHGATSSDEIYLVMEWLDGEDLARRLERGAMSPEDTVTLLRAVAEALGVAHARGIVHRDLKPSNLFLPGSSLADVKVLDFGVARISRGTRTDPGGMVGTPGYMAPEQARGDDDVDARADVFALGCVTFECLTGRRAFDAEHVMAVLAKILIDEVPRVSTVLPDVPPSLDDLVRRMVAKDPADRPFDAAELAVRLGEIDVEPSSEIAPPVPSLTRSEQRTLGVVLIPPRNQSEAADERLAALPALRAMMDRRGARLHGLADGSLIAVIAGKSVASDLAAQAAQCALELSAALAGRSLALTTARAEIGSAIASDAIDNAARLLAEAPDEGHHIVLDETTAGLLGARFEVASRGGRLVLERELDFDEDPRTLLGKATPCVGRDREIAALEGTYAECASEPVARVVLVTAPAGAGKSRLRNEVIARLRARSAEGDAPSEVWIGRGDPMRAGSPFALLGEMLRRACAIAHGEPLETRRQKLRERVARRVGAAECTRVAEFLGEILGVPFPDEASVQLRAARQDPLLMSDQVRSAWLDFVAAECKKGPVLLVLEDLHWGDLPTVKLVDAALRDCENSPLMVLAFARPEVHDLFPKLWEERQRQEVRLGGLTKKAAERLVREVLGASVAPETVANVVLRADGNAFYLEELMRAVAEGRGATLPETVVAMVEARLAKLDPEARRVLRAGSVFGQTFWKGSAAALLGGQVRLAEWLRELTEQELVTKRSSGRFPGEEEYAFRHGLLRDGAYATLTGEDKALGHVLAGDWLERMGEPDAMTLAEHFERGGARERAVPWFPRATEQALEGNDLEGALARAERGIACGAEGRDLGLIRCLQAEARNWRGENADAFALASGAMELLPKSEASWFGAAREAIITAHKVGRRDDVVGIVDTVRREPGAAPVHAARGMALAWGATMLLYAGKYAEAEAILEDLATSMDASVATEPRLSAIVHRARAIWAFYRGSPEATRWLRTAMEGFEASGDLRNASITRADLGFVFLEFGSYAEAERLFRQSLVEAERMGLFTSVAQVKQNLGLALLGLGRLDEAAVVEREAVAALTAQGQKRASGLAETYLARILLRQGDLAAAEAAVTRALEQLGAAPGSRAMALAVFAQTLLRSGQRNDGLARAREAMDLLRSLGALEEGEALVRLTYAEALEATGDEAGRVVAMEAKRALLARAEKIEDPALRRTFLESVDENRATLNLAENRREI